MKLSDGAEEILEKLWIIVREEGRESPGLDELGIESNAAELGELARLGYVVVSNGAAALRQEGMKEAEKAVRRHRLAERLLTDLFRIKGAVVEENACRFEHVLQKDVEESVCTLLGHPKSCPHGKPIPEGSCCRKAGKVLKSLVFSARDADKGARGKIAYLETKNNKVLQKLMAMGMLPGVPVEVMQTFPAYVLTVGNTQVAVDKEMAECVFIRSGR